MNRVIFSLLAVSLTGCSWFGGSDVEPPAALVEFTASQKVEEVWSANIGKGPDRQFLRLSPVLHDGILYSVDTKGRVRALNREQGQEIWRTDLDMDITGGVGYGMDLVLVASRKGEVVALEKARGKEVWRHQVTSEVLAPPAAESGVVVVQSVDGKITGLAGDSGKRLWVLDRSEPALSLRGTATPVILSDAVLTGFASGKIVAINLKSGRLLWETPVSQPQGRSEIERLIDVDVPVLVSGHTLLAAAYQGKIVAVSLDSGRLLWSREISTFSALAADASKVYVVDTRSTVYALDLSSGATIWKQDKLARRDLSAAAVSGDALAVADFEGYVHWLARDDGHFLARTRVAHAAVLAAPVADGNWLYVYTQNGYLVALHQDVHTP